jgi:hypothetical protein
MPMINQEYRRLLLQARTRPASNGHRPKAALSARSTRLQRILDYLMGGSGSSRNGHR